MNESFSSDRQEFGVIFQFIDIACSKTEIEKMPGHGFLDNLFISITEPGKTYFVPVVIFGNNVKKFYFACPAFDAVAFHSVPPFGRAFLTIPLILSENKKNFL
jgi:hypothetical protein